MPEPMTPLPPEAGKDTFSREYVEKLREENAAWRSKLRDTERKVDVVTELTKRGIQADPSWISVKEGETIAQSVDSFLVKYPQFSQTATPPAGTAVPPDPKLSPVKPGIPPVSKPPQGTNVPTGSLDRPIHEIKADPVARAKVRDQYREMLKRKDLTI